jgi:hypothetical protein
MKKQKQDIDNLLETALFVALLVLFMLAFSNPPQKSFDDKARQELVIINTPDKANAAFADAIRLPSIQKYWVSSLDQLRFKISANQFKLLIDNKKTVQTIISLQKYEQQIKPINICKFYYYLFPKISEEPPFLS